MRVWLWLDHQPAAAGNESVCASRTVDTFLQRKNKHWLKRPVVPSSVESWEGRGEEHHSLHQQAPRLTARTRVPLPRSGKHGEDCVQLNRHIRGMRVCVRVRRCVFVLTPMLSIRRFGRTPLAVCELRQADSVSMLLRLQTVRTTPPAIGKRLLHPGRRILQQMHPQWRQQLQHATSTHTPAEAGRASPLLKMDTPKTGSKGAQYAVHHGGAPVWFQRARQLLSMVLKRQLYWWVVQ